MNASQLYVVNMQDEQPLGAAIEAALASQPAALETLPTMTNVALGDPYLAGQLTALHESWEIQPPHKPRGLLARIRSRLVWWLLKPELQQINLVHATLVRALDSTIVQLDQERAARRQLEEQLAYQELQ